MPSPSNTSSPLKATPNTASPQESQRNPMDSWTTSNMTHDGHPADAVVAHPITDPPSTYAASRVSSSQSLPIAQSLSSSHTLPNDQNLASDRTNTTLSLPAEHNESPPTERVPVPPEPSSSRACFDHGCNGRVFSSRSNLLRHQRERTPFARLLVCPMCGTTFYRLWTRDQHIKGARCRRLWHRRQYYRLVENHVTTSQEMARHSFLSAV